MGALGWPSPVLGGTYRLVDPRQGGLTRVGPALARGRCHSNPRPSGAYHFFFLAAHGLHGLQPFLAAQGLHPFLAAHGLQPLFAAQGLQPFLTAHGLQAPAFAAAQGLKPFCSATVYALSAASSCESHPNGDACIGTIMQNCTISSAVTSLTFARRSGISTQCGYACAKVLLRLP